MEDCRQERQSLRTGKMEGKHSGCQIGKITEGAVVSKSTPGGCQSLAVFGNTH